MKSSGCCYICTRARSVPFRVTRTTAAPQIPARPAVAAGFGSGVLRFSRTPTLRRVGQNRTRSDAESLGEPGHWRLHPLTTIPSDDGDGNVGNGDERPRTPRTPWPRTSGLPTGVQNCRRRGCRIVGDGGCRIVGDEGADGTQSGQPVLRVCVYPASMGLSGRPDSDPSQVRPACAGRARDAVVTELRAGSPCRRPGSNQATGHFRSF